MKEASPDLKGSLFFAQDFEARPDLESPRILIERLGGLCPGPSLVAKMVQPWEGENVSGHPATF